MAPTFLDAIRFGADQTGAIAHRSVYSPARAICGRLRSSPS